MTTELNVDAATVAAYLAKLEGHYIPGIREAKSQEDLRELVSFFVLEHYQHELDMAALRMAGTTATKDERLEAAEAIKARIAEIRKE
jgi:hypothetical protein